MLLFFFLESCFNFVFHPGTCEGVLGQQQQELLLKINGLIDTRANFVANLHIFGSEPTPHAVILEISVEATSKRLILAGVGDKAGVVLNGMHHANTIVVNPFVWYTGPPEKMEHASVLRQL